MKVEGYLFAVLAVFLIVVSAIYWILSEDPTGTTCIALSGGLALIIGYYLLFTARRMDLRPEDRADAEISEGSGEVGFFPPHSWWPILLAGAFTISTLGFVFGWFVLVIGFVLVMITTTGLLFEYYVGINRSQGFTLGQLEAMGEPVVVNRKFLGEEHHS